MRKKNIYIYTNKKNERSKKRKKKKDVKLVPKFLVNFRTYSGIMKKNKKEKKKRETTGSRVT